MLASVPQGLDRALALGIPRKGTDASGTVHWYVIFVFVGDPSGLVASDHGLICCKSVSSGELQGSLSVRAVPSQNISKRAERARTGFPED